MFVNSFLHFLHFVFKVFDHLYYHYSEFFFMSFAYFLLIYLDFCVSSLFLHLCSISLPFHYYYFLTCCVWGLLFPGFKVEFFLPFGFCPLKVVLVVRKLHIGWDLCWVFVCLLFLWWSRLSGVVILSADDWVCIFCCCCLAEASCTGCYWWLGDARACIQVVSFVWVLTIWYSLGLVLC